MRRAKSAASGLGSLGNTYVAEAWLRAPLVWPMRPARIECAKIQPLPACSDQTW